MIDPMTMERTDVSSPASAGLTIRDLADADADAIVIANDHAVPDVTPLPRDDGRALVRRAWRARGAERDGRLVAFVIALDPRAQYESPNFGWFRRWFDDFVYVDRIVVTDAARRLGVASALYADIERAAWADGFNRVTCEVHLRPPNPVSLRFHQRAGFGQIGTQRIDGGDKTVALLMKPLATRS